MLLRDMMQLRDVTWLRDMTVPTVLFQLFHTVVSLLADLELHRRVKVSNSAQLRSRLCRVRSQTLKQLTWF